MIQSSKICVALLLAACAIPALAQDQDKPAKIVLEEKVGSVMASTGGDYESAKPGKLLVENESLMLTDGAKATVVYYYSDGKRKCTEVLKGPNTYVIDDECHGAGYLLGNSKANSAVIVGAALLGAALVLGVDRDGDGSAVAPPVSGSIR